MNIQTSYKTQTGVRRVTRSFWTNLSTAAFTALLFASASTGLAYGQSTEKLSFNRDVRPILSGKCFACHGFDSKKREGNLRLDVPEGATVEVEGHRVIVPGDVANSEFWKRITSTDEGEVMPPPATKKHLTDDERAILKRWIEEGAEYQKHWAFEPVVRPSPPADAAGKSPVDAFLEARIKQAGLIPNGPADKATLIRRVSFALTGLPPTLGELDSYLNDNAEGSYERMVDRYLDSPRYGEEMAKHWLDVARYADTHGMHLDNERQMWAYRDWVIQAFNQNLPFDQFTVWQIAGDLLPEPTREQIIATGFNRCNVTTGEGGSIDAEFIYRYAVERTTTVNQVWLGMTAGCAVCHDHKYDPITAKDFYSMYAFFNSAADPAMDGNIDTTPPFVRLPNEGQKLSAEIARKLEQEAIKWAESLLPLSPYVDPASQTLAGQRPITEVLFADAFPRGSTSRSSSRNAVELFLDPKFGAGEGRRVIRQASAVEYNDNIEFKLRPIVVPQNGELTFLIRVPASDVPNHATIAIHGAGNFRLVKVAGGMAKNGTTEVIVKPNVWNRLTVPAVDLGLKAGDRIPGIALSQNGGVVFWDKIELTGDADRASDPLESLAAWRKVLGTGIPPELPGELHPIIQGGPDKQLNEDELTKLRNYYLTFIARPQSEEMISSRRSMDEARESRLIAEEGALGTFVYRELPNPRESFVMLRGQYDKPADKVEPAVPSFLPQVSASNPNGRLSRLDLANWLVSKENPLTARVTVNRLWQQFFGVGLVKTSYDFGSQGDPPTHPELLDWLSTEYRDNGWNTKAFVKMLLMTEAFQRSSQFTDPIRQHDPANRLYARGPRFRLDAEQVRDNVLAVSGLLKDQMGGRGVKPYQPANIWEPVGYADSNTRFYLQDHGDALYRRSIYIFLKRTAPPPFMANFDAPNREQVCTVRERSNTPLQALQMMNDIQHFEAARALAERLLAEGGATDEERIRFLFRVVLSRLPDDDEVRIVKSSLEAQKALFTSQAGSAAVAIAVGESQPKNIAAPEETAAWTMVANLILNTDEVVNRN